MDLISAIDLEIAQLEDDLRADPRQKKLRALKDVRALYLGPRTDTDSSQAAAPKPPSQRGGESRRKPDPARQKILDDVETYLTALGPGPVKTSALFDILSIDHAIGGKEPKSNLSAMIYNSGRFVSHGRAGWTNKPAADPETNGDDAAV